MPHERNITRVSSHRLVHGSARHAQLRMKTSWRLREAPQRGSLDSVPITGRTTPIRVPRTTGFPTSTSGGVPMRAHAFPARSGAV